jgi:actin-related protein
MSDYTLNCAIVIDSGTGWTKAGFAGDSEPKIIFPSVVARVEASDISGVKTCYVGDDIPRRMESLVARPPIDRGVITHWDDMEALWRYAIEDGLRVSPIEHAVCAKMR